MPLPASPVRRQKSNNKLSSFLFQLNPVFIVYFLPFIPCNRVQMMFWFRCFPQTVSLPSAFTIASYHIIRVQCNVFPCAKSGCREFLSDFRSPQWCISNTASAISHSACLPLSAETALNAMFRSTWVPLHFDFFPHTKKIVSVSTNQNTPTILLFSIIWFNSYI